MRHRRITLAALLALALAGFALLPGAHLSREVADANDDGARTLGTDAVLTVTSRPVSRPLPGDFSGVSIEYPALADYAPSGGSRPLLAHLLLGLSGGHRPLLRIGGDSTDTTWWPGARGLPRARDFLVLSPAWLSGLRAIVRASGARVILGVNLEAGSVPLAVAEARGLLAALPADTVAALEPGNEPLRYGRIPWYRNARHRLVYARPLSYSFGRFAAEFHTAAAQMPGGVPLAGPTLGGSGWMNHLGRFLAAEPRVRVVTDHSYPLNRCFTAVTAPNYGTLTHLLDPYNSQGLAARLANYVHIAHRRGLSLRIDELNSVACGGRKGVSDTFASSLWILDTLFAMAQVGVDGVNVHTFPRADYGLFTLRRSRRGWRARVSPEYYGMLAFADAAPAGSRLLATATHGAPGLRTWATRGTDGTVRVTVINTHASGYETVLVRVPGRARVARLAALTAPAMTARGGVRFAVAQVGASTGRLGPLRTACLTSAAPGVFRLELTPASAVVLTAVGGSSCAAGDRLRS